MPPTKLKAPPYLIQLLIESAAHENGLYTSNGNLEDLKELVNKRPEAEVSYQFFVQKLEACQKAIQAGEETISMQSKGRKHIQSLLQFSGFTASWERPLNDFKEKTTAIQRSWSAAADPNLAEKSLLIVCSDRIKERLHKKEEGKQFTWPELWLEHEVEIQFLKPDELKEDYPQTSLLLILVEQRNAKDFQSETLSRLHQQLSGRSLILWEGFQQNSAALAEAKDLVPNLALHLDLENFLMIIPNLPVALQIGLDLHQTDKIIRDTNHLEEKSLASNNTNTHYGSGHIMDISIGDLHADQIIKGDGTTIQYSKNSSDQASNS